VTPPVFIVKRFWQGVLVRSYGPFAERGDDGRDEATDGTANGVARAAARKHPRQLVIVEPVHPEAVRR
jgi:hypothetical protein